MLPRTCWLIVLSATLWATLPAALDACSVPVYRFALDRWEPDAYAVTVIHRGPLTAQQQAMLERLRKARRANIAVSVVEDKNKQEKGALPRLVARYPDSASDDVSAWEAPFDESSVTALLESPARREIGRRILDGQSAVWVLLECGTAVKDEAAARLIEQQLAVLPKELKLPVPDDAPGEEMLADTTRPAPRIEFSLVRISRKDAAERALASLLLNTEADLKTFDEPIAFAVFGRGRVLEALVGKGINERNVRKDCAELTDACSCEIKRIYPGRDLLMTTDWGKVTTSPVVRKGPKPASVEVAPPVSKVEPSEPAPSVEIAEEPSDSRALQVSLYVLGALAAATTLVMAWMWR